MRSLVRRSEGPANPISEDLDKMFEDTIERIFKLVREQIRRTRKAKMPPIRVGVRAIGMSVANQCRLWSSAEALDLQNMSDIDSSNS